MRYVLRLEAICDSHSYHCRAYARSGRSEFGRRELDYLRYGHKALSPWVARISICSRGEMSREFVPGVKDYADTNNAGTRGIFFYYALAPGVYQINERTGWTKARRYFLQVIDDARAQEMTREEVMKCLPSED